MYLLDICQQKYADLNGPFENSQTPFRERLVEWNSLW